VFVHLASLYILDVRTTNIFVKPLNPVLMKRRIRRIANFFAFNLLFFALYLNFIHKDKAAALPEQGIQTTAAVSGGGTILVNNPEKYLEPKAASSSATSTQQTTAGNTAETANNSIN
jgi:hypothetical protein